jgi:uncharacterized protein YqhQ
MDFDKKTKKHNDSDYIESKSSLKQYIALLFIFIIVMSNIFIDNILTMFGPSAVLSRKVTTYGIILQGLFLVFLFIVVQYLIEKEYI